MREAFAGWAGGAPATVWSAPGRVNLIGEHTDYNGGYVLPFAIDRRTTVAVGPAKSHGRRRSLQFPDDDSWGVYVDAVVAALGERGIDAGPVDVLVDSDVPTGAGLSSSAALEVGAAGALAESAGVALDADGLVEVAHRAEDHFVGVPVGIMDQTVVVKAVEGSAVFIDTASALAELVAFDPAAAGVAVVVIDSGVRRQLADGRYAERRRECREAAAALGVAQLRDATVDDVERASLDDVLRRRARHVVTENERVLRAVAMLRAGDLESLGPLLLASHASLRDDFEVSVPALDTIVERAVAAGALGARMTGAGFGGCAIAIVPSASLDPVLAAFETAWEVRPAAGARRC